MVQDARTSGDFGVDQGAAPEVRPPNVWQFADQSGPVVDPGHPIQRYPVRRDSVDHHSPFTVQDVRMSGDVGVDQGATLAVHAPNYWQFTVQSMPVVDAGHPIQHYPARRESVDHHPASAVRDVRMSGNIGVDQVGGSAVDPPNWWQFADQSVPFVDEGHPIQHSPARRDSVDHHPAFAVQDVRMSGDVGVDQGATLAVHPPNWWNLATQFGAAIDAGHPILHFPGRRGSVDRDASLAGQAVGEIGVDLGGATAVHLSDWGYSQQYLEDMDTGVAGAFGGDREEIESRTFYQNF